MSSGSRRPAGVVFIAQEILVDHASYPTRRIAANSHRYRPIGLGYSNLGSLMMAAGLPYDSDEARGLCGAVTALLHGAACRTSTELAAAVGPLRWLREEPRVDAARDGNALGEGRRDQALPEVSPRTRPAISGTKCSPTAGATASATPKRRCWRRRARSVS